MRSYRMFLDLIKHSKGENCFSYVDVLSDNYSPRQRSEQAKHLVEDGFIEIKQLNANDTCIAIKGCFTEKGLAQIESGNLRQK